MFPEFTFPETPPNTRVGVSVVFDMQERAFCLVDGAARECTDADAVRQWIELLLHTKRGKYPVYGATGFGITVEDLIGSKTLPGAFVTSELKREIWEGLALCPAIERADGFSFSREGRTLCVSFTVYLYDGTQMEVTANVG